jgi:ABC-type dipeptide/oligopeptide/nickel transport system permease subunit
LGRQPSVTGLEALAAAEALDVHGPSPARAAVRRFVRDKRAVVSLAVVLFLVVGSFVFPLFYRHMGAPLPGGLTGTELIGPERYHDPSYVDLTNSDLPGTLLPLGARSSFHPLGTDVDGRDILARLLAGINISIEIALLVEVFDIGLGILLGTLAGWYGGWLGTLLDRSTDIVFAFPGLLLVLLMGAALGPLFDTLFHGAIFGRMLLLTLAIGLLAWPLMMRYVRGQTLLLKEQPYIEAARTAGTSNLKLILRHVVPNLVNIVVVASTLNILATIIGEAGISLLGAGLKPPASSLGLMISDATTQIYTSWTELFWPCAVLVALVLSLSFVGDGVRDAFDPRTKE